MKKRLIAFLMASALLASPVLTIPMTVNAGSITVNHAKRETIYHAYKLFDGTFTKDGSGEVTGASYYLTVSYDGATPAGSNKEGAMTYESLSGIVPQPRTFRFKIDPKGYWKRAIENLHEKWQAEDPLTPLKLIIKPLMGVDCEDIVIIENIEDLSLDLDKIFKPGSRVIVQEFIEGTDISVSLICDGKKAIPLSLNKQFVELKNDKGNYIGGKLPFESKYGDEAFEIATKAVEAIDGLKGFVGVDLIINADEKDIYSVYLLEINSRFTTPYVGLKQIANINIGKSIVDLIDGKLDINELDISLDGDVEFKKSGDNMEIRRL